MCADKQAGHIIKPQGCLRRQVTLDTQAYVSARIIWKMETDEEPPEVDHWNNDSLDDRWDNLRAATHTQNCQNRRRKRTGDIPKGVQIRGKRFAAFVTANGIRRYLGTFDTPAEASLAYQAGVALYHMEYARPEE